MNQYPYSSGHYFGQDDTRAFTCSFAGAVGTAVGCAIMDAIGLFLANLYVKHAIRRLKDGKRASAGAAGFVVALLCSWVPAGAAVIQSIQDGVLVFLMYCACTVVMWAIGRKMAIKKLVAAEEQSHGSRKTEIAKWRSKFLDYFTVGIIFRVFLGAIMAIVVFSTMSQEVL